MTLTTDERRRQARAFAVGDRVRIGDQFSDFLGGKTGTVCRITSAGWIVLVLDEPLPPAPAQIGWSFEGWELAPLPYPEAPDG